MAEVPSETPTVFPPAEVSRWRRWKRARGPLVGALLLTGVIALAFLPGISAGERPTVALTGTLVLVTTYYAWQSARASREMEATRRAQVRPKIVLSLAEDSTPFRAQRLMIGNVGSGPAIGIDVVFAFGPEFAAGPISIPDSVSHDAPLPARWHHPLLASGSSLVIEHAIIAPFAFNMDMHGASKAYGTVRVAGSCLDVLGLRHLIDETLDLRAAVTQWVQTEPGATELARTLGEALRPIERALDPIAWHFRWSRPAGESGPVVPGDEQPSG